jgi:hypothetical protein
MKYSGIITTILLFTLFGCQDKESWREEEPGQKEELSTLAEGILRLKSTEQIYADENSNEYISVIFDIDKTSSVYGIFMEEGKKYYISATGKSSECLELLLLESNYDTLFTGEYFMGPISRKYITWTSNVTDTFYIKLNYVEDINFHTKEYQITFEDLSTKALMINGLDLTCSGDWFTVEDGSLGLVCHQTGTTKWTKIENDSLYNYSFAFKVSSNSGKPDHYMGIACYASDEIWDAQNMPADCYLFDIIGPNSWRVCNWMMETGGGVGYSEDYTSQNLVIGKGNRNHLELKTFGDSIACMVNQECVTSFRNHLYMDNGLYIAVEDTKKDTLHFADIDLELVPAMVTHR